MLLSHQKKFIYLKTIKTASTSVESFFEPYCLPAGQWQQDVFRPETVSEAGIVGYRGLHQRRWFGFRRRRWFDHMPAWQVKRQLDPSIWNSYFKFCVIRNPFDKVVSAFHFFQGMEERGFHKMPVGPAESEIERFRSWVEIEIGKRRRVVDRYCYTIKDSICVDYFIRFENLKHDIGEVCKRVEVPLQLASLPNFVSRFRPQEIPLLDYYDEPTRQVVERVFDFELAEFGYQFPGK
jgi:hypothetical protein